MIYLRHFLTFLLLFAFTSVSAQSVNKMLYTNDNNVGILDFSTAPPTDNTIAGSTVATDSEGITHVQNSLGTLLFYVKSDGIFNSDGTLMSGSPNPLGDADITEVNVTQIPGSPNQYYVFYTQSTGCSHLYFSKVDLSGASGVVFGSNTLLGDTTNAGGNYAEGKEVVNIPNSTNKWLVVYNCDFGFERFEITQTNVNGPVGVKGWLPTIVNPNLEGKGELDYHAEYLAYASAQSDVVYSFRFNPCTGKSEGPSYSYPYKAPYGVEFSPSAFYLYATTLDPANVAAPGTDSNIVRIQNVVGTMEYGNLDNASDCNNGTQDVILGQLELGSNEKIYTPGVGSCTMFELGNLEATNYTVNRLTLGEELNRGLSDITQSDAFINFINLDVTLNHISCNGGADGSISLSITGGIPPYEVTWYDGSNLYNKSNLTAGSYMVSIKDQSCGSPTLTRNIFIAEPDTISIELETEDAVCFNGIGDLEYSVTGGTPPYNEVWPVGFDKNNPTAGDHHLIIIDNEGCTAVKPFTIESPEEITWTDSIIHATCFDGYGTVYMNELSGGVRPFVINGRTDTVIQLKAGQHKLQLIDRNGCIVERFISINEPDEIEIEVTLEQDDCNVFSARGTAEASGGSGDLVIEWLGIDKDNIPPGKYAVRAIDTNGCEGYKTFSFVPDETLVRIPTIFTPNGDGVNEYFQPVLECYREFNFEIYSRWGEEVFVSTPERDKWYGFDKSGKRLPSDVYIYVLEYIDSEGFKKFQEGSVMLTY